MQVGIDKHRGIKYIGKDARLFNEWEKIDERFKDDGQVSYIIRKRNALDLPTEYDIYFNIKTITGVEEADEQGLQKPIFEKKEHEMRITLPNNYPGAEVLFTFRTPVWHPNIRYFGDFKGHVCLNQRDNGVFTSLVEYIDRVIHYLLYEDYHAINDYPYPEDLEVAKWVREQAEPQGWLQFKQDE